ESVVSLRLQNREVLQQGFPCPLRRRISEKDSLYYARLNKSQDKPTLVALLKRIVPVLLQLSPKHQLWIVEPDRIRYREEWYSGTNNLNTDKGEVGGFKSTQAHHSNRQ